MRLQKYIALCGVASRRKAEELIKQNRVKVNDVIINEMGHLVDEESDVVKVDNNIISQAEKKLYYAFNKPKGVISSSADEKGRKCVLDYFSGENTRLFTVGRLDYDSSGLILVTNDGEFANHVTHPKYESEKSYEVKINGSLPENILNNMRKGMMIEGYKTSPAKVKAKKLGADAQFIEITIREGRNRQIRKMIELSGAQVKSLHRVSVGSVRLNDLKPGEYRRLSHSEINYFYSLKPKQKQKKQE